MASLESMEAKEIVVIVGLQVSRKAMDYQVDLHGQPGPSGKSGFQCTGQVLLKLCTTMFMQYSNSE